MSQVLWSLSKLEWVDVSLLTFQPLIRSGCDQPQIFIESLLFNMMINTKGLQTLAAFSSFLCCWSGTEMLYVSLHRQGSIQSTVTMKLCCDAGFYGLFWTLQYEETQRTTATNLLENVDGWLNFQGSQKHKHEQAKASEHGQCPNLQLTLTNVINKQTKINKTKRKQ